MENYLEYQTTFEVLCAIDKKIEEGGGGGGGIPDAPKDGSIYGRKDGEWAKVEGGGSTGKVIDLDGKSQEELAAIFAELYPIIHDSSDEIYNISVYRTFEHAGFPYTYKAKAVSFTTPQENWVGIGFATPQWDTSTSKFYMVMLQDNGELYLRETNVGAPQEDWEKLQIDGEGNVIAGNGYWLSRPFDEPSVHRFENQGRSIQCSVGDVVYPGALYSYIHYEDGLKNGYLYGNVIIGSDAYLGIWLVDANWQVSKVSFTKIN